MPIPWVGLGAVLLVDKLVAVVPAPEPIKDRPLEGWRSAQSGRSTTSGDIFRCRVRRSGVSISWLSEIRPTYVIKQTSELQ